MEIDIADFTRRFNSVYNELYTGKRKETKSDLDFGDNLIVKHDPLVAKFNNHRKSILSSDREVRAFAITYKEFKDKKRTGYYVNFSYFTTNGVSQTDVVSTNIIARKVAVTGLKRPDQIGTNKTGKVKCATIHKRTKNKEDMVEVVYLGAKTHKPITVSITKGTWSHKYLTNDYKIGKHLTYDEFVAESKE